MEQQITEEIKKLHVEILEKVKGYSDQVAKFGEYTSETKEMFTKMNSRMDMLETIINRPNTQVPAAKSADEEAAIQRKGAWSEWLRKGNIGPDKMKLLTESNAETGGFFAIPEYETNIVKGIVLISPVRQYARVRQTGTDEVKVPKRTSTASAKWVAETETENEWAGLTYGLATVPNHELTAMQGISNRDLEDSAFPLDSELQMEFTEQFAKSEGSAFVSGSGKGQPEGFLTNAAVATDKTGTAGQLTYAGFVNCYHNLKSAYAGEAVWFMNRQTIGAARLLVDGENRPLWLPSAQSGMSGINPPTILGAPVVEMPDMPAVASGNYVAAFGAWKRAYLIVDRIGITTLRDPYTFQKQSSVMFYARRRVGGQVILAEAIRKLQASA